MYPTRVGKPLFPIDYKQAHQRVFQPRVITVSGGPKAEPFLVPAKRRSILDRLVRR